MTRTNVEIDDELIATVMARYKLSSKRSAVDFALRQLAIAPKTRQEVVAMRGSGFELTNDELEGDWAGEG
jgi:Arc/MetJ family transcription regulator